MSDKAKVTAKADALLDPAPTVKARVRSGNHYGKHEPGAIVDVTEREIRRVPHALIALADEAREAQAAVAPPSPTEGAALFRSFRKAGRLAVKATADARAIMERRKFEALGFKSAG